MAPSEHGEVFVLDDGGEVSSFKIVLKSNTLRLARSTLTGATMSRSLQFYPVRAVNVL